MSSRWTVLSVLTLALALISLDNTIVNVALPSLQEDLGATTAQLQWVIDAYSVLFAGTLLLAGSLGDRFGRRRALLIGLWIFGLASLAAGFADTTALLIVCRAVMGVGAAFIMPSTLSILVHVFDDRKERAQAIGIWAAIAGAAIAVGPVLGGLLIEYVSWHAIFWVNPPLVALTIIATHRWVPESLDPSRPLLDPLGAALSTFGIIALVVTVIQLPDSGLNAVTLGSAVATVVLLGAFVWWEHRAPRPILPMSVFRQRLFTISVICVALVYAALMGVMFFLPQFLQLVQDNTPLESGISTMPGALGLLSASLVSPALAARWGPRLIVITGLLMVCAGLVIAGYLTEDSPYAVTGSSLGLMGLGLGMVLPQATNGILASVPAERSGMGSAVNDGMAELGGSLGVAILGSLLAAGYRGSIAQAIDAAGTSINQVPAGVVTAVQESLASGSLAIAQLPRNVGDPIRSVAAAAFVSGMTTALLVAAGITLVGAILAWWMFPSRVPHADE